MKRSLLILTLVMLSCRRSVPEMLIQLDGAKERKAYSVAGMDVLEYRLDVVYPAKKVVEDISKRLEAKGWKPLPYMYMYPNYKSSHVEGWSLYQDPPKNPSRVIYEWSGDWQDTDGNIVTYTFRYLDPFEKYRQPVFMLKPGNSTMLVTAIYMEEAVAKHRQIKPKPQ